MLHVVISMKKSVKNCVVQQDLTRHGEEDDDLRLNASLLSAI